MGKVSRSDAVVAREEEGINAMQCTAMRLVAPESTRVVMFTIVVRERIQGSGLLQPPAALLTCRAGISQCASMVRVSLFSYMRPRVDQREVATTLDRRRVSRSSRVSRDRVSHCDQCLRWPVFCSPRFESW